ncbi:MAG: glycosyltransferase family 39 protein [Candidatus Aminicenantales bacterium]
MMTSDDAVMVLMGKHIAEGRVPPICLYGQNYIGSLSSHFYALMFWVFGYSIFLANLLTLMFYLAFMAVHFLLMRAIFSPRFALATSAFYALPFTPLIVMSFDKASAFPLILFLCTAMVYTAYKIETKEKTIRAAQLGFLMGLAFWTHPISACFILTSLLVAAARVKIRLSGYFKIGLYALLGFLPQLLLETFTNFRLLSFLTSGEKAVNAFKIKKAASHLGSLLADQSAFPILPVLVLLLAGFVVLAVRAAVRKKYRFQGLIPLFVVLFFLFYFASPHSGRDVVRYLYPLYFCLPVLLLTLFLSLKPRVQLMASGFFLLVFFGAYSLKGFLACVPDVRDSHHSMEGIVSSLKGTGLRYWRAEYWRAYLLTCLSKEELIVDAYTSNRYAPYTLMCENLSPSDNFIFVKEGPPPVENNEAAHLQMCLDTLGVKYKMKECGNCWLITGVESRIPPQIFRRDLPQSPPAVVLDKAIPRSGYLELVFKRKSLGPVKHYRLQAHIPGFSSAMMKIPEEEGSWSLKLPYPDEASFPLVFYLDYYGIVVPSSRQRESFSFSGKEIPAPRTRITWLSGFSQDDFFFDRTYRLCQKSCTIALDPGARDKPIPVRIFLFNPFPQGPLQWYNRSNQELEVLIDGKALLHRTLRSGASTIDLTLEPQKPKARRIQLSLNFKYQQRFSFAIYWNTAALVDRIVMK